ncbi:hypothetical protein SAMN04488089_106178 [Myroides profundi]|uniref:Uncharacterized protein n=1 Tax=Myroides profundi TaxID=480520 RepID=A0AAJ5BDY4_MYRPR|nr:hypothetical protein MPR_3401 [Myroides profundi]SEQ84001.1 hypothetical protein SAMN04488089_106178 [Myroides profundi]
MLKTKKEIPFFERIDLGLNKILNRIVAKVCESLLVDMSGF